MSINGNDGSWKTGNVNELQRIGNLMQTNRSGPFIFYHSPFTERLNF